MTATVIITLAIVAALASGQVSDGKPHLPKRLSQGEGLIFSFSDPVTGSVSAGARGQAQPDSADALLAGARKLFDSLDYERALIEVDKVVALLEPRRNEAGVREQLGDGARTPRAHAVRARRHRARA